MAAETSTVSTSTTYRLQCIAGVLVEYLGKLVLAKCHFSCVALTELVTSDHSCTAVILTTQIKELISAVRDLARDFIILSLAECIALTRPTDKCATIYQNFQPSGLLSQLKD